MAEMTKFIVPPMCPDRLVALGKEGNPFATLCYHCFGRHKPPHTEICPHDPPKPSAAERYGSVTNGDGK